MPPTTELTVKELAERERVTVRTVYRWIDKGAVVAEKTYGKHHLRIIAPTREPARQPKP